MSVGSEAGSMERRKWPTYNSGAAVEIVASAAALRCSGVATERPDSRSVHWVEPRGKRAEEDRGSDNEDGGEGQHQGERAD